MDDHTSRNHAAGWHGEAARMSVSEVPFVKLQVVVDLAQPAMIQPPPDGQGHDDGEPEEIADGEAMK
jgi:hypothetical protein